MEYTLFENKLTKDIEDDYSAKHVNSIKRDRVHLVQEITGPGSILKETETNAVINAYWNQIINYIKAGEEYRDENIAVSLSISGTFIGKDARFDREDHEVNVSINPSKVLKQAARDIRPQYVDPNFERAIISNVFDWGSNSENRNLTPNGVLEVKGINMKIYEHPQSGVFFIDKESGEEVKVDHVRVNEPRTLQFKVPALTAGTYKLEIRNSTLNSMQLRTGGSELDFTVA
ncbi:MAG: DNA-binding domain-containing protein [Bacteroidales bacterium]